MNSVNVDPITLTEEDKQKIKELLKKPWNLYIRRHSALTEKSSFLKEHILRQHAGWSPRSQMHLKYLHYFGNESSDSILEAYGIITKDKAQSDTLRPKQCPNCNEANKPDSIFCAKCRMVLTYDAYSETLEKEQHEESEVQNLKEKIRRRHEVYARRNGKEVSADTHQDRRCHFEIVEGIVESCCKSVPLQTTKVYYWIILDTLVQGFIN